VISAEWGNAAESAQATGLYSVDMIVDANDRQGLLRDISEVLSREKINVTAVNTLSRAGAARMSFTVELNGLPQLQRMLKLVREVSGVVSAWRG
ncbi:MAG: GTP pyrophosphokinase, partial [Proteobacteria bacterium]|nr:GTP pyrophosphokinase [Pseudomonadota bacterium]